MPGTFKINYDPGLDNNHILICWSKSCAAMWTFVVSLNNCAVLLSNPGYKVLFVVKLYATGILDCDLKRKLFKSKLRN